jgi:hypothetical protein
MFVRGIDSHIAPFLQLFAFITASNSCVYGQKKSLNRDALRRVKAEVVTQQKEERDTSDAPSLLNHPEILRCHVQPLGHFVYREIEAFPRVANILV